MRVVVTNPPWPGEGYGTRSNIRWPHRRGDKVLTFPIYLAYTVAVLKKEGFETHGIDAVDKEWGISTFVKEMKKLNPSVIIMEASTPSIMYDLETAEQLKKEFNPFIVFCGPHATYFHKKIIENYKFVDACIRKEFEYTARDLCLALKKKKSLKNILGLTYRNKNKVIINKERPLINNLDELPFPEREDFKIENYQQAFFGGKKTALMISSRGCPYRCSFCLWPNTLTGNLPRIRSAKNITDEIEYLIKNYNVDEIYFDDDTFVINKNRIKQLRDELKDRNIKIPWLCMGRVDTVDQETLDIMKEVGCKEIFYGLESGSEEILKDACKGITLEQMKRAIKMTQKSGIVAGGSFIIGLPKESKKTVNDTIKFAKSLHADYVQFALASPFPGTKLFEEAKNKNLLKINSWSDLDGSQGPILETEYLSRNELNGMIRKAYLKYYTSPGVIWQNLKNFNNQNNIRKILRGFRSFLFRLLYYKR